MSKDTGGPAFPSSNDVRLGDMGTSGHAGMTLRDWFAGKAMQGAISNSTEGAYFTNPDGTTCKTQQEVAVAVASASYLTADAMIAERNK